MKLYTMKLYTELEILERVPYEIVMRRERQFFDRVEYVKDDPATGEPLYQILPEPPPNKIANALLWIGVALGVAALIVFDCLTH